MIDIDGLLQKAEKRIAANRRLPESTYRLQFHSGFTFRNALQIVDYLNDLGVTHCYASPYLKARPGSQHGYDIIDHRSLNPEIGSVDDYDRWIDSLHAHGMGQILDIVPNHMGIGGCNPWWTDVLENGPASAHAGAFDIAWLDSPRAELRNRVLLPVLGAPYGQVLEAGLITLEYSQGAFSIRYFEHSFPVSPNSYGMVLAIPLADLESTLGAAAPALLEYKSILTAIEHLPLMTETDSARLAERQREKEIVKRRLDQLASDNKDISEAIAKTLTVFNGDKSNARSFDQLDRFLNDQAYRLCYWQVASDEINYRRFFDINDLAALNMEKVEVFSAAHELVLRLLAQGKVDGLRIDHPDGLFDPQQYLFRLQQYYVLAQAREVFQSDSEYEGQGWSESEPLLLHAISGRIANGQPPLYVVVEKILDANEDLPTGWMTNGTSGYDFINATNGLYVDTGAAEAFTRHYQEWLGDRISYGEIAYHKKRLILRDSLSSEFQMLSRQLDRLAQKSRWSRDFTLNGLRKALGEVIACFPVYRSYISDEGVSETDQRYLDVAVIRAIRRSPTTNRSLFQFVHNMLSLKYSDSATEQDRLEQRQVAGKFQQVTAPVTAKGLEDTAFYVYNRLLSLNEVGGDPSHFGLAPEMVHRFNQKRQAQSPYALSPLSTHDSKRSEDVRSRLNVLSEMPEEWNHCLTEWHELNEEHVSVVDEGPAPDRNDECLLYQTLVGAWPVEPCSDEEYSEFVHRIQDYMVKAMHEAKVHTSWINPNEGYDNAVRQFVVSILDHERNPVFLNRLRAFQKRVSHFGMLNSLSQTLLKIASPGVPDTYQGTELWDFSLVDPDNRRPIDYMHRRQMLSDLQARMLNSSSPRHKLARELIESKEDGRVKLYVTSRALGCRRERPGLFSGGEYLPLEVQGDRGDHAFAFVRRRGADVAIAVAPRLMNSLELDGNQLPRGGVAWRETRVLLPDDFADHHWHETFTGLPIVPNGGAKPSVRLAELFADFPMALLVAGPD